MRGRYNFNVVFKVFWAYVLVGLFLFSNILIHYTDLHQHSSFDFHHEQERETSSQESNKNARSSDHCSVCHFQCTPFYPLAQEVSLNKERLETNIITFDFYYFREDREQAIISFQQRGPPAILSYI